MAQWLIAGLRLGAPESAISLGTNLAARWQSESFEKKGLSTRLTSHFGIIKNRFSGGPDAVASRGANSHSIPECYFG